MSDPTYREMLRELRRYSPGSDELDYEEAVYWFAADYHSGQASNLYAALGETIYSPGITQTKATGEARRLYNHLECKYANPVEDLIDMDIAEDDNFIFQDDALDEANYDESEYQDEI